MFARGNALNSSSTLMQNVHAYLLLGSNLGDRYQNLQSAISMIGQIAGSVVRSSSVYQTAAWGNADQPDFYNISTELETPFDARRLLQLLLEIEVQMGRVRDMKWGARIIDIDILFFGEQVIREADLMIPHPGIPFRRFALEPMHELRPDLRHPESGLTIKELLLQCPDKLEVKRIADR
jgi:2-amino-4-hydroxy-6-hydroxymethyldihydropteridine diphosphokinase